MITEVAADQGWNHSREPADAALQFRGDGIEVKGHTGAFLEDTDLKRLTGRHQKSRQIEWLRAEGIPFRVSATGHPVVLWAAINGERVASNEVWQPRALEA